MIEEESVTSFESYSGTLGQAIGGWVDLEKLIDPLVGTIYQEVPVRETNCAQAGPNWIFRSIFGSCIAVLFSIS